MYKLHTFCRACGLGRCAPGTKSPATEKLKPVFNLGVQPLANDFCNEEEERAGWAPLEVLLCPRCNLAQLSVTVDPAVLYKNYKYVTSPSKTMQGHFQHLLDGVGLESRPMRFLEIGSNDGAFLEFLRNKGHSVMGIDPAFNLCKKSVEKGIPTWQGFFGRKFLEDNPGAASFDADFVFARHVFCHVDDWTDFVVALSRIGTEKTRYLIEVPYVMDLLHRGEFDTIYHEHTSYLSIQSMECLLFPTSLRLHKIERLAIHGGALLITLVHKGHKQPQHKSVLQELAMEQCGSEDWRKFSIACSNKIAAVREYVCKLRANGKRVAAYGASAKSTVWINACHFTRNEIEFIADATSEKQYRTSPGSNIPIVHEGLLGFERPDYALMFCWNFAEEVIAKEQEFLKNGGQWIIPHPEIRIISKDTPLETPCVESEAGCIAE